MTGGVTVFFPLMVQFGVSLSLRDSPHDKSFKLVVLKHFRDPNTHMADGFYYGHFGHFQGVVYDPGGSLIRNLSVEAKLALEKYT